MSNKPHQANEGFTTNILSLYKESIKNFPLLRYSWVLIAAISILSLIGYFKLKSSDVIWFALAILGISFLGYILSLIPNRKDTPIKIALYILIYTITLAAAGIIIAFGTYIAIGKPKFIDRYFTKEENWSIPPSNYEIQPDSSSQYTPYVILVQKSDELNNVIRKMDSDTLYRQIILKWKYADLVRLIYTLNAYIPVFYDPTLCYKCHSDTATSDYPSHIKWTFESIYLKPEITHKLWRRCFNIKQQQVFARLIEIKNNPELYKDKIQ